MYVIFDDLHFRTEEVDFIPGRTDQNCFIWIIPDSLNLN